VRQLEALLLVRNDGARAWTAEEVSAELRSGLAWTLQQLEDLRAKRLLVAAAGPGGEPAYRYAPADRGLASIVDTVADLFSRRKTTVIRTIFGSADEHSLRSFSDAFRIRRDR
jgi:hypothetical protein